MSKNDKKEELPYVEPNSGATAQPGGFVAYGAESVMPAGSDTPAVPDNDPEFEAKQGEAGKAVEGENPNGDGQQGDAGSEASASPSGDETEAGDNTGSTEENDYSELLEGNVPDVQKYLDEHPDEADAVKAAEKKGKGRAGVLDH